MDDNAGATSASTLGLPENVAETSSGDARGALETQAVRADKPVETSPNPRTGDAGFEDLVERFGAGVELDGSEHALPTNHRQRAEALAERGAETDPLGIISPELVADAKGRLAAYDKAYPPLTGTKDQLGKIAEAEGVALPDGATKDEIVAAISAARPAR